MKMAAAAAAGHRRRIAPYHLVDLCQQYSVKFVLEVLGGVGAIWGSTEAVGLRTSSTAWFFRPLSLAVGAVFLMRWLVQLRRAVRLLTRGDMVPQSFSENDLALTEELDELHEDDDYVYGTGTNRKDDSEFTTELDYDYGTSSDTDSR